MTYRFIQKASYQCLCWYCSFTINPDYLVNEDGHKIAKCPRCGFTWSDFIFDENGERVKE